jgi:putative Ca2+/H+ antiporter (TMEM165/GDT1 family)
MMLANVPAVLLGERLTKRVPVRAVQVLSAAIFVVLGIIVLIGI